MFDQLSMAAGATVRSRPGRGGSKTAGPGFNTAGAQGRQLQGKHVQPVKQILAEAPGRHLVGKVTVGGGNNADIQVDQFGTAQALDFPLLQHPQQFRLQLDGHLGDLVEQQRAAVGLFKFARTGLVGAGKGTLLVTKEDRLQHVLGNTHVQCQWAPRCVRNFRALPGPVLPCRCPIHR